MYTTTLLIGLVIYLSFLSWELYRRGNYYRNKALYDPLTSLPNNLLLEDRLNQLMKGRREFSVIFADLNDLKKVNDTEGHQAGDRYILESSRILSESVRIDDTVARLNNGGDEFVIVLVDISPDMEQTIMSRIHRNFEEFGSSVSLGLARFQEEGRNVVQIADERMYDAKLAYKAAVAK